MDKFETERLSGQNWPPDLEFLVRWWVESKPIIHRGLRLTEAEKIKDPETYRASIDAMISEDVHLSSRRCGQLRDMLSVLYAAIGTIDVTYEHHRKMPTFDLKRKLRDMEQTGNTLGRAYKTVVRILQERTARSA